VPALADILNEDLSEDYASRHVHSEPTPPSVTPKPAVALRPTRSAPPLMALTPLTEETEADLRSTSHVAGQSDTLGQLGACYLSTACQGKRAGELGTLWHKKTRDGYVHNNAQAHSKGQGHLEPDMHLCCVLGGPWLSLQAWLQMRISSCPACLARAT
jgi:hypothetical protein